MKRLLNLLLILMVASTAACAAEATAVNVLVAPRPDKLPEAARLHLSGSGVFVMNVDTPTGKVKSVEVQKSTGHSLLDRSAIETLKKWRFRPGVVRRYAAPIIFRADSLCGSY
jgi:TonB family protein